jgi:branched-chain amino acid transport system substrate-binding protein
LNRSVTGGVLVRQTRLVGVLSVFSAVSLLASACGVVQAPAAGGGAGTAAKVEKPAQLKIAMVDFMSGGAAKFGTAALNAGALTFDQINEAGGIGGVKVSYSKVDEAGTVDQVVTNYRRLVLDEKVDAVIGYTSSANCLAVAPVAEELKKLTIIHICGTYRLFEDAERKYVVRSAAQASADAIGAAYYTVYAKPDVKTVAAINDDYAWGRDSWEIYSKALQKLKPDVKFTEVLWPKAFVGEYSAEISKLEAANADVIHTSLWGGHMDSFIKQANTRGLFKKSLTVFTTGETGLLTLNKELPAGIALTGRGQYLLEPDPERWPLNKKFIADYTAKYNEIPVYPSYRMVQAVLAYKTAVEKALALKGGNWPTQDEVILAMENSGWTTPTGPLQMRADHESVQPAIFGITSATLHPQHGFPVLEKVATFPEYEVTVPPGRKTIEWIDSWPASK